jgi:hypothetical protein
MRVMQYARLSLSAAVVAFALSACGKDSSGPSEFNAQGTTSDMAAAHDAFASEPSASFVSVGAEISAALGGSPVAITAPSVSPRPTAATLAYARQLVRFLPGQQSGIQASMAAIPSEIRGTTYVWDEGTDTYVASDAAGAPSTGVRFLLYAIDPVIGRPVEPVVQVAYVDVLDHSTTTTTAIQVKVVSGSTVYLDYNISAAGGASSGSVTVSGYAFNGATRADFSLALTGSQSTFSLDYSLKVPSRKLSLDWTATIGNITQEDVAVTLDFAIAGPNGDVRLVGTMGATGGTFTVKVNGSQFATITLEGDAAVITGANGASLTPEEEETLHTILDYYDESAAVFEELLQPLSM